MNDRAGVPLLFLLIPIIVLLVALLALIVTPGEIIYQGIALLVLALLQFIFFGCILSIYMSGEMMLAVAQGRWNDAANLAVRSTSYIIGGLTVAARYATLPATAIWRSRR